MIPTQASPAKDRDFPRLNGNNFIIWKTRVAAALDGKNLLGFVTQADYAGDSDVDLGDDEELNPACHPDIHGVAKPDSPQDSSSSEASDGSSDDSAGDDGDVDMEKEIPPVVLSFTAQKKQELDHAEKLKAKSRQLSAKKLRHMEAKAKAFLINTIDDQHVLMVKEKTKAYEIYHTLCSKYEDAAIHGDPYFIQSYLMALKYKEGSDQVQNELARNRYVLKQGTPESQETRAKTAMPASAPEQVLVAAPPKEDTALAASLKCTYCHRDNHDTVECFVLQRHPHNGHVKAGTVLPANFKLKPLQEPRSQQQQHQRQQQTSQRHHPYKGNYNGNSGNQSRNNNRGPRNGNRNDNSRSQGRNKYHGRRNRDDEDNSDYGIIAITTLDLSQDT
ncbi:hypothetical protein PHYSODRAFT_368429, partial [Phytophthora sojae]